MKKSILLLLSFLIVISVKAQNSNSVIEKQYQFTIPSRGEKYYEINVPEGAKKIKAVVSGQTEMVNLKIYGPTNVILCKTTTWSYLSNWKKPLNCSASIVNNQRQKPGIWKVKIEGSVHKNKIDKIKKVSGTLTVYIETKGNKINTPKVNSLTLPFEKKYDFTVSPRGEKYYEINVPEGAKKIKAVVSGQTEMVNLKIYGPTNVILCKTTTWSYLSNWKKPLNCSASIVNNQRQKPGIWKVKIEGSVHKNKIDKIKKVSGTLTVYIN